LPLIGLSSCAATGNIYAGLYYPMMVASVTFIVESCCFTRRTVYAFGTRLGENNSPSNNLRFSRASDGRAEHAR